MTAAVAVQSPGVQERLVREMISRVSGKLGGKIEFSSINYQVPGSLELKDVMLLDNAPYTEDIYNTDCTSTDTLLFIKEASATVSPKMLLGGKGIHISRLDLRGAEIYLSVEPGEGRSTNYSRIFDFGRDSTFTIPPVSIGRLHAEDIRYRMSIFSRPHKKCSPDAINYFDMDALFGTIEARDISIRDGYVCATADKITVKEKCGEAFELSARTKVGHGVALIKDIHMTDAFSDIHVPLYSMTSSSIKDYKDYCTKVRMKMKIAESTLASSSVSAFAMGRLSRNDFLLAISEGEWDGYVSDLNIRNLKFTDLYGGVKADAALNITGITITPDLVFDGKVNKLSFTTDGAGRFASRLFGKNIDLSKYAKHQNIVFSGSAKGPMSKLAANGRLKVGRGSADAALTIRDITAKDRNSQIAGTFRTRNLDAGKIIGRDFIGKVTANTGFKAILGNDGLNVRADSLIVDNLSLLGYDYTGIAAAGTYSDNAFDGKIICADPNLNFIFQGIFNLSPKTNNALYKFSANVGYADLEALHLDNRGGTSKVSAELNANLMKIPKGDILGDFNIYDLTLENDNGVKYIGDIYAGSHTNDDISRAQIRSSFLDAGYVGNRNLLDIIDDIQTVTTRRELPALYSRKNKDRGDASADYDITVDFHDSRDFLSFIKPGVYIADSTRIDLRMKNGNLAGRVRSPRLAYLTNYLKGLDITVDNLGGSANA